MFIVRRLSRLSRTFQFALVAAAAFAVGSATVAAAATAGIPVGSLFYLPMINGMATTPCSTATGALGATTTCNAVVDSNGNLHVSSTGTSTVNGSVSVSNFPPAPVDQQVHGTVGVSNLPDTQKIAGHVNVDNLPGTQTVDGTVNVGNLPATQAVTGTVSVGNLPTDANGNLNVNVVGGASGSPGHIATRLNHLVGQLDHLGGTPDHVDIAINMNVTYMQISGCDIYRFYLSGGGFWDVSTPGFTALPVPIAISSITIFRDDLFSGCSYNSYMIGY